MGFDVDDERRVSLDEIVDIGVETGGGSTNPTFSTQGHIRLFLICEKEKSESNQRAAFRKRL